MELKHILRYYQSQEDTLASIPSTFYQPTILTSCFIFGKESLVIIS